MKNILLVSITMLLITACQKNTVSNSSPVFQEVAILKDNRTMMTYQADNNHDVIVVFESGLGDGSEVWTKSHILEDLATKADMLIYDRAGYGKSAKGNSPGNIENLRIDLESIISTLPASKKVILVGHSLGGMIIRDFAIKNSDKTAALLFVDSSHENYNNPSQQEEDALYKAFANAYGTDSGGAMEARELIEDIIYLKTLPDLPNIPVIALTSAKTTNKYDVTDRQKWYDAQDKLGNGLSDFTHYSTQKAGHYIQLEEPELVKKSIFTLITKIK